MLENRVAELQNDKAEAKIVIEHLIKMQSCANGGICCNPGHGCSLHSKHTPSGAEETRNLLMPVIGLLHDIVRAGILERQQFVHSDPCPSIESGNLLDFLDEEPLPEVRAMPAAIFPDHPAALQGSSKLAQAAEKPQDKLAGDQMEQTDAQQQDLMSFEMDSLAPAPLVTRFRNAQAQSGSRKDNSMEDNPNPVIDLYKENLEYLEKPFDESRTELSGPTQYDASASGSASIASPNSSFHNSDDEADLRLYNKNDEIITMSQTLLIPSKISENIKANENLGHTELEEAGPISTSHNVGALVADHAALFMPKWPVKSFAVSSDEREGAVFIHQKNASDQERRFPDMFRYGIRFRPNPKETDLYRTIAITQLPSSLTLSALLQQIRGGAVVDAKLLDTTSIDGHFTALIIFAHEFEAKNLENKAREEPLRFLGKYARVVLLPTPTWPTAPRLRAAIGDHQHTRCLEVHNFPLNIKPAQLEYDLRVCHCMSTNRIEEKRKRQDGVLELRFNSVDFAGQAYAAFTRLERYKQCKVKYVPDPCAQPYGNISNQYSEIVELASLKNKEPESVKPDVAAVTGITRWKEYAYETFTGIPSLTQACVDTPGDSEDFTDRSSPADVDEAAKVQRGRGFTTNLPVVKTDDNCLPQ
ncbi:MAG: hypothetical protein Q9209_006186 [Squamulea sp. 1 TL-2023]